MNFKANDKVVCISSTWCDDPFQEWITPGGLPVKDRVYVVSAVFPSEPMAGLVLVGLPAIRKATNIDEGFVHRGFRKLEELQAESRDRYYASLPETAGV